MQPNSRKERYPFSIVWTPIPLITWLIPFIGHMGICNSEGVIFDFIGPYMVNEDNFGFGKPTKVVRLDPSRMGVEGCQTSLSAWPAEAPAAGGYAHESDALQRLSSTWDACLKRAVIAYSEQLYNFFTNNCHCFVARALNQMCYDGHTHHGMVNVWWRVTTRAQFISWGAWLRTYLPFLCILAVVVTASTVSSSTDRTH